jgi:threonine/homoserine/homoserine lactone efflux protein
MFGHLPDELVGKPLNVLLNSKAAVCYAAVLPTFVDGLQPVLGQTVLLSVVYDVATAIHTTIVALAGTARPFLEDPSGGGRSYSELVQRLR